MPAGARSRISRSPSRSSEQTGSSNQRTSKRSANSRANQSACLRESAPFASTKSSVSSPIASRATRTRSRSRSGSRPTFIFTRGMPCADPAAELLREPLVGIGGEASAAVDRHRLVHGVEQRRQRQPEQARLQVPERGVDGGDRHRGDAGPAEVAAGSPIARQAAVTCQRVAALDDLRQACRGRAAPPRRRRRCSRARPRSPACASTSTIVVESHSAVPSDSG